MDSNTNDFDDTNSTVEEKEFIEYKQNISKIISIFSITSFFLFPFAGCSGGMSFNGLDILQNDSIDGIIKFFLIIAITCGIAIVISNKGIEIIKAAFCGIASFLISYFIAKDKFKELLEIKIGGFLSFGSYLVILLINYLSKPKTSNNENLNSKI